MAAPCVACHEPLVFPNEDGIEVPDDLQLICGCHFHWQVLIPALAPLRMVKAGSSSSAAAADSPEIIQILTRYINESGLQENYDVYPDIAEEAYYATYPQHIRARPFLAMCGEGHVQGVIELCREADEAEYEDDNDNDNEGAADVQQVRSAALLRHQDPLSEMMTGLHVAIANNQIHMAYLLLYLASRLPLDQFPPELLQFASQIERPEQDIAGNVDIRSLQTAQGETAEVFARRQGGIWAHMAQQGIFSP
ncbi:hypothetical protein SEPCBS119000_001215 [Sporothrix epigloea]|uniref:Uncharacterized protein n=1 Tax=Sporothrix epigloea TaxID=1892477 RepID=A0ABP0DB00_9PEZI